ncbi:MAG: transporter substrate-binding domain-containing protein [Lentisphaeria bacterium]|nr:transporter substrate-binding domain-containing protein [Lentisphaeria bacterium]
MKRTHNLPGDLFRTVAQHLFSVLFFLTAAALLSCCGKKEAEVRKYLSTPDDLNSPEYTVGIVSETSSGSEARLKFPRARFREYETVSDAYPELENGSIDAIAYDRPVLDFAQRTRDVFVLMPDNYAEGHVGIAVPADKPELLQNVNAFLREYFSSGLYDNMYARWIKSNDPEMPKIQAPAAPYGKLVVGTENTNEPMNFTDSDGSPAGFDTELIYRLAAALNMSVEIRVMPYLDLFTAVEKSTVDLAVASMDKLYGENRAILFSEDYIDCPAGVMTRKTLYKPVYGSGGTALKTPQELAGNSVAILAGSKYAAECKELLPHVKFLLADSRDFACSLLISNKIDSILMEEPLARTCTAQYPEIRTASLIKHESYSFALAQGSPLYRAINRVISELKDSGELENLAAKWCSAEPAKQEFEKQFERDDVPMVNGVLRYAATPGVTPLCFMGEDGTMLGLEIEIVRRAALEFGMTLQIIPAPRELLPEMLRAGQIDMAGGMLTPDAGNTEGIEFSQTYYEGGAALVTNIPHDEYVFGITRLKQLTGKRVGVLPFTFAAAQMDEKLPDAVPFYASQERDLFYLLGTGKIDAFVIGEARAREYLPNYPQFLQIPEYIARVDYSFFFPVAKRALSEAFSRQIRAMKKNGVLKALQNKWISPLNVQAELPAGGTDAPNGVLRMGVVIDREPFSYLRDEKLAGYDLETAQRAAAAMGFLVEFVRLNPDELEQAIADGRVDFVASDLSKNKTSSGRLVYSEPFYSGGIIAVVPDKTKARPVHMALIPRIKFFLKEQAFSLQRSLWKDDHMRQILGGFKTTLIISVSAVFFGTILGIPLCMLRQSKRKGISIPADIVCALIYNIPILILLMGLYYVIFRRFGLSPLAAAIVLFILRFMASSCRLYMTTMDHIGGVQIDAARALCLRRVTFFRRIILPQAAGYLAKPFREEIIRLVELTTVVGYVSVWDLTKMVDWIRGRTYESFFPIAFATLLYFILSFSLIAVISFLSKKFEATVRKKKTEIVHLSE